MKSSFNRRSGRNISHIRYLARKPRHLGNSVLCGGLLSEFRVESRGHIDNHHCGSVFIALTSKAAVGGNTEVLRYLLENGAKIGSRSLEAAFRHGNPECVRLLLDHGATDNFKPGSALLESVKKGNETVFRQLMASGIGINDNIRRKSLDINEKEGLISMAKIVEEYD